MININSKTINTAWWQTFTQLIYDNHTTDNQKYYRDEPVLIQIDQPRIELLAKDFPLSQTQMDIVNRYITTGENEDLVEHPWTKIYYHRIFDEPQSQMRFLLKKLKDPDISGRTQIALWDKSIDQDAPIAPCTQIIWCRIKAQALEMHVHSHSSNAYNKLLLNLNEFVSLQIFIAKQLGLKVGKYYHFIDSCHILYSDIPCIKNILTKPTTAFTI